MVLAWGGGKVGNSKKDYKQFAGNDMVIPESVYFDTLFAKSKNQIVWGGNYMTKHLPHSSGWIFWDKVQPEKFTMAMGELAWSSFQKPIKYFKQRIVGADVERIHPTQKPVALYEWLITTYAKPNDRILDTHLGSGSSAIAANKLGFEFVGIELDKDYFNAACKRIEKAISQQDLFAPNAAQNLTQAGMF